MFSRICRLASVFLLLAPAAPAEPFTARYVGVTDGDTLTVLTAERSMVKVRLEGIDAPERGQPFGDAAKRALSALVYGKEVEVLPKGKDLYGRTLADVIAGGMWINLRLVEGGHAWRYDKYSKCPVFGAAQDRARRGQLGLWSVNRAVPPWEWRKAKAAARVKSRGKR